ncbi:DedA family protein [Desulfovibrio mangrovi]|uniref:DedA family protein n=1 Tax=Desulfovibrio mangrovi TaxID=2976983 RepID=UPI0022469F03|nr:DedA family protein [Desulfovibrio mangrovi]UZP66041.1 DedA family protein [Desulfovibrio mangrovi]
MTLEAAISTYGYLALWLGTFLEGETILIFGGLAAHQGYLSFPKVVLVAFAGSLMGDQLYFYLGRRHNDFFLSRFPRLFASITYARKRTEHYETLMILLFRFIYGIRTATPFMYGMSNVNASKFAILNAAGAMLWAIAITAGGYYFGHAIESYIGQIKKYELELGAAIIAASVSISIYRHIVRRKKHTHSNETNDDSTAKTRKEK